MIDFTLYLNASNYQDVATVSKVFNLSVIGDHDLWVVLPYSLSPLYTITNIHERNGLVNIAPEDIFREGSLIQIKSASINHNIGLHQYKISLQNNITSDVMDCYFQYIIQDDNPETPYIYMKREENENATGDIFEQDVPSEQTPERDPAED